jgi:hypothetical protein
MWYTFLYVWERENKKNLVIMLRVWNTTLHDLVTCGLLDTWECSAGAVVR